LPRRLTGILKKDVGEIQGNNMKPELRRSFKRSLLSTALLLAIPLHVLSQPLPSLSFEDFLTARFTVDDPSWNLGTLCPVDSNIVAARVLREYGSMFVAGDPVQLPDTCLFRGEAEVKRFQKKLKTKTVYSGGIPITLQQQAAEGLQASVEQAALEGLSISPLDGAIAGSRSYGDTLMLWNGRFFRALDHWTRRGRLTAEDREAISRVDLQKRIEMIIEWEAQGIYFSTDRTRSIFTSTAPPGASQHLSMLAFDVVEYGQPTVREILNRNGWFQTVVGDPPHFTFLGLPEDELQRRGLLLIARGNHRYWVPNLSQPTR
jgi:hypothetical protein